MPFVQNTRPCVAKQPRKGLVQIANADGQSNKSIVVGGGNGSKITAVYATSTDTSARDIQLAVNRGGTNFILGTTTVAAGAGNSGSVPSADLLNNTSLPTGMLAVDNDGQHYIYLESADTLVAVALTTVTTAKLIAVHADYADF